MSEKDERSIEDAMVDSLAIDKVRDLVGDVAELGLDSILEAGLLKDIPLIGFVAKSVGAAFAIRDRIFAKKVLLFLLQLDDVPQHKKHEFVDSLKDEQARRKIGETLLLLLDRLDDIDKAAILGRLFAAYVEQKISYSDFRRLSLIIGRVFTQDLQLVLKEYIRTKQGRLTSESSFVHEELSSIGLMERPALFDESPYRLTEYAHKLVEFALNDTLKENNNAKSDD